MSKFGFGVGKKIAGIVLSFALPLGVLLHLVVKNIDEFIAFAEQEELGNQYQRPLEQTLRQAQALQLAFESGDASQLGELSAKVRESVKTWGEVDRTIGKNLQFTEEGLGKRNRSEIRFDAVSKQWSDVEHALERTKSGSESDKNVSEQLAKFLANIRTSIVHAGDTSNLILDPDLDSYYLMDVTLLALPQTQSRLSEVIGYGEKLAGKTLSNKERVQMAVYAAMLSEADLGRTVASTQTSLTEDQNFYGKSASLQSQLPPALEKYKQANEKFIQLVRDASALETGVSRTEWLSAGKAAWEASFDYWSVAVNELDVLLKARIQFYDSRKTKSLLLSGLAILIALGLSLFVSRSITTPLLGVTKLLGPGATLLSQCVQKITKAADNNDRGMLTLMCEELDAQSVDMKKTVGRLESVVYGVSVTGKTETQEPAAAPLKKIA
jgi:methyl-accepting chemotaxis protein